jgi:uncharacterized protein YggT (Ycf19 family)
MRLMAALLTLVEVAGVIGLAILALVALNWWFMRGGRDDG